MPGIINRLRILRTEDFDAIYGMMKDESGCLIWTGALEKGTGCVTPYYKGWRVRKTLYIRSFGDVPAGKHIRMTCKKGLCCNEAHMTVSSNTAPYNVITPDTRGTLNGNNILSVEDVLEIRRLYECGDTSYAKLGMIYDVDASTIGLIIRGKNWKWLQ